MTPSSPRLSSLALRGFRNHRFWRSESFGPCTTIIVAPNGSGKTSILEALSLFVHSKGIRRAPLLDMVHVPFLDESCARHHAQHKPSVVDGFRIDAGFGAERPIFLSMRFHAATGKQELTQDDARLTRLAAAQSVPMIWMTPTIVTILTESRSTPRRDYLDGLTDLAYPTNQQSRRHYHRLCRERVRLLQSAVPDLAWCGILEEQIAHLAVELLATRSEFLYRINERLRMAGWVVCRVVDSDHPPPPSTAIPFLLITAEMMLSELRRTRPITRAGGITPVGPHVQPLAIENLSRGRWSHQCSTGECKAMLIELIASVAGLLRDECLRRPLVLLDEFSAFLDSQRQVDVLHLLDSGGTHKEPNEPLQFILTTIDVAVLPNRDPDTTSVLTLES